MLNYCKIYDNINTYGLTISNIFDGIFYQTMTDDEINAALPNIGYFEQDDKIRYGSMFYKLTMGGNITPDEVNVSPLTFNIYDIDNINKYYEYFDGDNNRNDIIYFQAGVSFLIEYTQECDNVLPELGQELYQIIVNVGNEDMTSEYLTIDEEFISSYEKRRTYTINIPAYICNNVTVTCNKS